MNDFFSYVLLFMNLLNIIFAIIVIFYERKNTGYTLAWLMVLALLPYVGFILYLVFGLDARSHTFFNEKYKQDDIIYKEFIKLPESGVQNTESSMIPYEPTTFLTSTPREAIRDLLYLNCMAGYGTLTKYNEIELFNDGNKKFDSLIKDIEKAEDFIHIQYYIVRNDDLAKRVVEALADASKRGVEVKFIIDGMGCQRTPKKLFKPLLDAGGKLGVFVPPALVRINYRNHRKLCIIDGTIGYIGGLNIGDEYLGKVKKYGPWRDSHIKIQGEAVKHLELRFIMDWNFCSKDKLESWSKYLIEPKNINTTAYTQILSSGPDTKWPIIKYSYLKMISEAEKNIYIESPYFVPDDSIFETLKVQALSGIDIKIVIPANPDHPFVYGAAISYLGQLMEAGVNCYLYKMGSKDKGFTHSKTLMIDGEIVSVGTANMDIRSFELNFEINAFIFDKKITGEFEKDFIDNLDNCVKIDLNWYNNRGIISKVKESISRLLSPLL